MKAPLVCRNTRVMLFVCLFVILIYTFAVVNITRFYDGYYFKDSRAFAYHKLDAQTGGPVDDALYETQEASSWPQASSNSPLINSSQENDDEDDDDEDDSDGEKDEVAKEINRLLINVTGNNQQSNKEIWPTATATPRKAVRLLCWLLTDPDIVDKAVHARDTWMQRCDVRLFMSSEENKDFPTIGLNIPKGRQHIAEKSKAAWTYIYENHRNDADFFVKADPDSYIVVENLKLYLANCNPDEPAIYGHNLFFDSRVHYVAGEAVVLGRESLIRLVTKGMLRPDCYYPGEAEDLKTCLCLEKVGGYVVDTRDEKGRETFLPPFAVEQIVKSILPDWYTGIYRQPYGSCQNIDCLSDYPICFHYVTPQEFYLMDYLLRNDRLHSSAAPDDDWKFRFNGTRYFLQSSKAPNNATNNEVETRLPLER